MKSLVTHVMILVCCSVLFFSSADAQVSGVPGDGVPDIYYFPAEGLTAMTSLGPITRPAGTLTVDTDGRDMIAAIVGGQDATTDCDLCDSGLLPAPNLPPFFVSVWTQGFIAGSSQWLRTSPLVGVGFQGVIGEYDDPSDIFPDFGLANYGVGATFDTNLIDDNGDAWQAVIGTDAAGVFFTNVTGVPEPSGIGIFAVTFLGLLVRFRTLVT